VMSKLKTKPVGWRLNVSQYLKYYSKSEIKALDGQLVPEKSTQFCRR